MTNGYDLAVVGAGIVGLAHALAAARLGKRVIVLERDARANGASVRNFGFITITGQQAGQCWQRALRSRQVWSEVAVEAGIPIAHSGLVVVARRPEAWDVLEAFRATDMGVDCALMTPDEARNRFRVLQAAAMEGALWSPYEIRVEPRHAIPTLAAWLHERYGVEFAYGTAVHTLDPPVIGTSTGDVHAEAAVICPNDDLSTLFPERLATYQPSLCTLQMLKVQPLPGVPRLNAALMSDLSLVRYLGYVALPEAAALRQRLQAEQGAWLEHGIHLIVVANDDGSLVIGDSHHSDNVVRAFSQGVVEDLVLQEFSNLLGRTQGQVVERWSGTYPTSDGRLVVIDRVRDSVAIVVVTSGTGASTAFAIAEEVIGQIFGSLGGSTSVDG